MIVRKKEKKMPIYFKYTDCWWINLDLVLSWKTYKREKNRTYGAQKYSKL